MPKPPYDAPKPPKPPAPPPPAQEVSLNTPQPPPAVNDSQPVGEMVIADIRERMVIGRAKDGVALQAFNGRKPLVDAYQEAIDLALYVRQEIEERIVIEAGSSRIASEWREKARLLDLVLGDKNICSWICWRFGDGWVPNEDAGSQALEVLRHMASSKLRAENAHD